MFYLLGSERFVSAMNNGCPCNRPVLRLLSRFISSTQPPSAPALPLRLLQQALRWRGRVINFVSQHCGVCSSFLDKRDLTLHIANVVAHGPLFIEAVQSLFSRKFWPFWTIFATVLPRNSDYSRAQMCRCSCWVCLWFCIRGCHAGLSWLDERILNVHKKQTPRWVRVQYRRANNCTSGVILLFGYCTLRLQNSSL